MKISAVVSVGLLLAVSQPSTQKHIAPRIVGGSDARAGQFPYAAAIYITKPDSTTFCGGVLLSNLWVLTAANCIQGATMTRVQLGSTQLSGIDPNRLVVASDNLVFHPLFDPETLDYNLGLIMFRMAIILDDYIKPTSFFPITDLPGSAPVTALGWGQINDEVAGVHNDLQYVQVATLTNEECKLVYGSVITDDMVCVSGNYNEGICRGDNGSPLIQNVGGGHTLIVAIASFVSTNGCESTDPSGYTRVFPNKEWISNVTGIR
ncbi:hypothetical protein Zmor_015442 [Zophobas morio]|uniref:Peptidase S1 domain-containing protein n=1 Tax=Zophobas morio TaxID=2755281 RepID=A0AA38IK95_9CUCU|nr:hypothetical protein Zmor_015442 [Zophobas morio]